MTQGDNVDCMYAADTPLLCASQVYRSVLISESRRNLSDGSKVSKLKSPSTKTQEQGKVDPVCVLISVAETEFNFSVTSNMTGCVVLFIYNIALTLLPNSGTNKVDIRSTQQQTTNQEWNTISYG